MTEHMNEQMNRDEFKELVRKYAMISALFELTGTSVVETIGYKDGIELLQKGLLMAENGDKEEIQQITVELLEELLSDLLGKEVKLKNV